MFFEKKVDRLKYMVENIFRYFENFVDICNEINIFDNIRIYFDYRFIYSVR